jgi:hypothetical protein
MRRFTTSAATERPLLGALLLAELVLAGALIGWPSTTAAVPAVVPANVGAPAGLADVSSSRTLSDGRTVTMMSLPGADTSLLADRFATELDGAVRAVTAFWGDDWPRQVLVVAAGNDQEFLGLDGGTPDNAATTTAQRILFAPCARSMSRSALRIVLRHELFHYASRSKTTADAPQALTEGVADFVARPAQPRPGPGRATELARLPTAADFDGDGATRALAYDRAWWFSRYVADRYGPSTLRSLYLAACGPGHADVGTAVRHTLGAELNQVLVAWRQWLSG